MDIAKIQAMVDPLFPGTMGVRVTEASLTRIVADMLVRLDLCTSGGILHGGAYRLRADHPHAGGDRHQAACFVARHAPDRARAIRCVTLRTDHRGAGRENMVQATQVASCAQHARTKAPLATLDVRSIIRRSHRETQFFPHRDRSNTCAGCQTGLR